MAVVEWQTTCTDLKQRGAFLLQTEEWCDCVLIVGAEETRFRGHKLMLAMASPVFESMLFIDSIDETDTFRIQDVQPEAFKALLNYIYTENININSFEAAHMVYLAANQYKIQQLARVCAEYMICTLGMETACLGYEAGSQFQDQMLMYESLQMIKIHIKEILHHKTFIESSIDTVAQIFSIEDLRVEEIDLYLALQRWARAHPSRKRNSDDQSGEGNKTSQNLRKALEQIRFLTFSLKQFASGPAKDGLLTQSEALAVLLNIAGTAAPMPVGFSTNPKPRLQRSSVAAAPAPPAGTGAGGASEGAVRVSARGAGAGRRGGRGARGGRAALRLAGRRWALHVRPVLETSTSGDISRHLGLFLRCESDTAPVACVARVEFVLLAHKPGSVNKTSTMKKTFTSDENEHGDPNFVTIDEACMPDSCYNLNGMLIFEARIRVDQTDINTPSGSGQK